jgi:hypothetical protein
MIAWELVPTTHIDRLAEPWDALNRGNQGSALLEWRFVALLLRYFGDDRVCAALGTRGGTPVAMALLRRISPVAWMTFQPQQAPLGMWQCAPGIDADAAARSLIESLPGLPLMLSIVHQDPDLAPRPADAPGVRTLDYIRTARVLTADGFDAYWSTRGKNLRHNLKRQRNRLEREGQVPHLETTTAPADMAAVVADYGRLEGTGWKTATGTAVTPDNLQGTFYRAVLETFAQTGDAFGYRYRYNDRVVACDLCIRGNGVLNWLKTTYDESQTTSSPAALLRHDAFRLAFADPGVQRIEFYGQVMDWHTKWSHEIRTLYHTNAYRWPWLAGLHQRLRRPPAHPGESAADALAAED